MENSIVVCGFSECLKLKEYNEMLIKKLVELNNKLTEISEKNAFLETEKIDLEKINKELEDANEFYENIVKEAIKEIKEEDFKKEISNTN